MASAVLQNATGNSYIDGLLSGVAWKVDLPVTFSFPQQPEDYYVGGLEFYGDNEPYTDFFPASLVQRQAVQASLIGAVSSATTDVMLATSMASFVAISIDEAGGLGFGLNGNGDIRVGVSSAAGSGAYTYWPSVYGFAEGGDIWIGLRSAAYPYMGSFDYKVLIHELGHAFGLKHPHEPSSTSTSSFPILPSIRDAMEYTVMSYKDYPGDDLNDIGGTGGFNYPQTFMQYDILALQTMYGADYGSQSHNTNTTYRWSPTTGETFINNVSQGKPFDNVVFLTIWDGGGKDTYDMRNYSNGVDINLSPGATSTTSPTQLATFEGGHKAHGTIYNAFLFNGDLRSVIENAMGGSGNDEITGNLVDNILYGFAGDDRCWGASGNDQIFGQEGKDTLHGGWGNDRLYGGPGLDYLYGDGGGDTLFGDRDYLYGGVGDDNLFGDSYGDFLYGGDGNDFLVGRLGQDRLSGGSGRDSFDFNSLGDSGLVLSDVISDFAHGDKIDLRDIDAKTGVSGNNAFHWIGYQPFHKVKGELHYVRAIGHALVQGDVNGDGKADFEISLPVVSLVGGDFYL